MPDTGFIWGVSTASYQIEGGVAEDGRKPSIWDTRCRLKDKVANGDTGDVACDHYHRYVEDVSLMKALGVGAYRFSIAWPRVLPDGRGAPNEAGLAFYDRLIDAVLAADIEPWICLYHWDLPQALEDRGGWTSRDSVGWFADYAALVSRRYGDRVKRFATFNEPSVFTLFGYAMDWAAPGIVDRDAHLRAIHHVNLAHGAGVDVVRALVPNALIGAIHNRQRVLPEGEKAENAAATALLDAFWNDAFPDPQLLGHYPPLLAPHLDPYVQAGDLARICRPCDWFGLNHYGPIFARNQPNALWGFAIGSAPSHCRKSGIGWPIDPAIFRDELATISKRYRLPIYVTESGYGSREQPNDPGGLNDQGRIAYLSDYVSAMREAIAVGADVRGYFVWSLLDNFSWGTGYRTRFGLIHVDYATQRRQPKASAEWYGQMAKNEEPPRV